MRHNSKTRTGPLAFVLALVLTLAPGCSAASSLFAGEADARVLFIGNSHTHVNDVPGMVVELADANGMTVEVDMVAPGGWTLSQHAADGNLREMIATGDYDIVVLQEQSEKPAHHADFQRDTAPSAEALARMAQTHGAEVVFYQTWGREQGSLYTGHNSYDAMQSALTFAYDTMAFDNDAEVAPVGETWRYVRQVAPHIELFSADGNHASPHGSYLAAIVLTEAITDVELTEAPGLGAVDETTAGYLLTYSDGAPA